MHVGEATLLARLTATASVLCVVLLALLLLTALLRRLPRPVLLTLGFIAALIGLRALYLALRFHWLTGGVAFLGLLLAVTLLWNARLRWPMLSRRTGVALAACCGLGEPESGFARQGCRRRGPASERGGRGCPETLWFVSSVIEFLAPKGAGLQLARIPFHESRHQDR